VKGWQGGLGACFRGGGGPFSPGGKGGGGGGGADVMKDCLLGMEKDNFIFSKEDGGNCTMKSHIISTFD